MSEKMSLEQMLTYVDHTVLKPTATWDEIDQLCKEAVAHSTASVCIPPNYVKPAYDKYGDKMAICTVIGFPLGYSKTEIKVAEAKVAIADGATELDMVINICDVKNKNYQQIEKEIALLKEVCGDNILKVIIETCYLTDDEKIKLCEIITRTGADYIKTSTGFGSAGAQLEDIRLFKKHIGENVKIKAAGGIRTVEALEEFIKEGCHRVGSSAVAR